jgi:hypothetical protein
MKRKILIAVAVVLLWTTSVLASSGYLHYYMDGYIEGTNERLSEVIYGVNQVQQKLEPLLPERKGGHIRKPKEVIFGGKS